MARVPSGYCEPNPPVDPTRHRGGIALAPAHNPNIAIRGYSGEVQFDPDAPEESALHLKIDASPMAATNDLSQLRGRRRNEVADMCLAIPARVVELYPSEEDCALVEVSGVRRRVNTGLLQDDLPRPGDWVLIHVGFAMSKISEEDALDQIRTLTALGETESVMEEVEGYGTADL